jgi:RNA polymerase sigma-70 factor, ECF subfamily
MLSFRLPAAAICFKNFRSEAETFLKPGARFGSINRRAMETDIQQQLEARRYAEAFDLLVERFKNKVFRLAFSMMRDETLAEDVAQDVFVKIWKALPGYHGGASLSTWIYAVTRNTCLTELKKRSRRPSSSLQEPGMEAVLEQIPAPQSGPGGEMDVHALLAELPENYRRVVTLFYLEQKAYEEVAAMLAIPLGTVKTLLFRAKKELLKIGSRHARMISGDHDVSETKPGRSPTDAGWTGLAVPNLIVF